MEENNWCVYCHTNKANGKKYIGITNNTKRRWRSNGIGYKSPIYENRRSVFWNAIQKYGWDNFEHEILQSNLSHEKACELETYYINQFRTFIGFDDCNGYNATLGGDGTVGLSGKLNPNYGNHKLAGENNPMYGVSPQDRMDDKTYQGWINKQRQNMLGENNPMYGKTHTKEARQKISQANIDFIKRNGGHGSGYGIPKSEEHKKKISESKTGVKLSEETKRKIRENSANAKEVSMYDKDGIFIQIFCSVREAERVTGIAGTSICAVCNGKGVSAGGYLWRYANDKNNIEPYPKRRKSSTKRMKRVLQFDLNGRFIQEYQSVEIASKTLKINASCISACCRGITNTASGYIWRYADEVDNIKSA